MAISGKTINEVSAISGSPADDDSLAIWDTSESATKKITVSELLSAETKWEHVAFFMGSVL
jgi:hypothetical protein